MIESLHLTNCILALKMFIHMELLRSNMWQLWFLCFATIFKYMKSELSVFTWSVVQHWLTFYQQSFIIGSGRSMFLLKHNKNSRFYRVPNNYYRNSCNGRKYQISLKTIKYQHEFLLDGKTDSIGTKRTYYYYLGRTATRKVGRGQGTVKRIGRNARPSD